MNDFIIYILKSILGLSLFGLVYRISLIKDLNFNIRRIFLLISVSLAMLLPLFEFTLPFGNYKLPSVVLDEIVVYSNGIRLIRETSSFPLALYLRILYFTTTGFFLVRMVINAVIILLKSLREESAISGGIRLFLIKDRNISYSFFRNIFIGQTAGTEEQERIIAHEKVHALQMHSLDVLYIEILSGFFWFNPLIWWYRDEIRNVHEYLADEGALRSGFSKKAYQITLLEHLIGSASFSITNNFNYSLIKNRIAMMNKEKNGRKNTWKILLLMPVCILIVLAFACTQKSPVTSEKIIPENTAYYVTEVMPEFPGGFSELSKYIASNVTYPAEARENKVAGKVFVQFIVGPTGKIVTTTGDYKVVDSENKETSILAQVTVVGYKPAEGSATANVEKYIDQLKNEAIRVISSLPDFSKPGMKDGKAVAVVFTIPINFVLQ